jgi:hypothetical protein
MKRAILTALALVLTLGVTPPGMGTITPEAATVIQKMLDRNAELNSYQSHVHVDMRMLSFPFLSQHLDGNAYYKRPGKFEVTFDHLPSYARGIQSLFNTVVDPLAWRSDSDIISKGLVKLDGYPGQMYELYLTKRQYSATIADTVAYVDPNNYELLEMDFHYRNGGSIRFRQWYRMEGAFSVVSQQHLDVDIPHYHAVGDSKFGTYQTNIAIDDSVFKK